MALRELSSLDRVRGCGLHASSSVVAIVRRGGVARWQGVTTCGSVWACPVCSARILAERSAELLRALEAWHAQGGRVAMVTLTMRHGPTDALATCWDALSDAWAAATGRYSGARAAKQAAGVAGWVRRVEATYGVNGWHLHVHALVLVGADADNELVDALGAAMFGAWAARLARAGLEPVVNQGGLRAQLLELDQARAEVAGYVAKGTYGAESAALEVAGSGKLGRRGNLTPWGLLDAAIRGDRRARAAWHEWEQTSRGRRALTWSQGIRERLGLGAELEDDELAEDAATDVDELVAWWDGSDWPELRAHAVELLELVEECALLPAVALEHTCRRLGLPPPRRPS